MKFLQEKAVEATKQTGIHTKIKWFPYYLKKKCFHPGIFAGITGSKRKV
jgi:hypothetical protein